MDSDVNIAALAKRWDVSRMAANNWKNDGLPIHDDRLLAEALVRKKVTPKIKRKAMEFLSIIVDPIDPKGDDEVVVETHLKKTHLDIITDLEKDADRYSKMQQTAKTDAEKDYATEKKILVYKTLVEIRVKYKKLGEESGRQISKPEFERIVRAWASRASLGIQRLAERASKRLLNLTTAEQAINALIPPLISALFLDPFAKASNLAAGCGMPSWVTDTIRTECGNHIENGEKLLDEVAKEEE